MASIEKIAKSMMHEISDGKVALHESFAAYLRNQEVIIAQNKHVIDTLESINQKLTPPTAE